MPQPVGHPPPSRPSSSAQHTWQVVQPDHLVHVLVVCSHLGEEGAFRDTQHRRILGDVGLGKEQVTAEPTAQSKADGYQPRARQRSSCSAQALAPDPLLSWAQAPRLRSLPLLPQPPTGSPGKAPGSRAQPGGRPEPRSLPQFTGLLVPRQRGPRPAGVPKCLQGTWASPSGRKR